MSTRLILAASLLSLLLMANNLSAQDASDTEGDAAPGSAREESAGTGSQAESTGQQNEPGAEAKRDPFDYQASEQISEDLSVSLPVDI